MAGSSKLDSNSLNRKDYMVGPDLGLSEAEFKALVHQLTAYLDYLDCIWRGAEG